MGTSGSLPWIYVSGFILWLLFAGHQAATTVEPETSSTTLAYITRPPLILFTGPTPNRSHPIGHRRTLASVSRTSTYVATTTPTVTNSIQSNTTAQSDVTSLSSSSVAIFPTTTFSSTTTSTPPSTTRPTTTASTSTTSISRTSTTTTHASPISIIRNSSIALERKVPLENQRVDQSEKVELEAEPLPSSPTNAVRVSFRRSEKFSRYYLNCTDADTDDSGVHVSNSYLVDTADIFTISNLLPGHLYVVHLLGSPARLIKKRTNNEILVTLNRTFVATDPVIPRIASQNISVTTNSISFSAEKESGALQDYFLISYSEMADLTDTTSISSSIRNLNVTDIPDQRSVEFYVGGLSPGTIYNVSVTAFRRGKASRKWNAIIITTPLPPVNVRVINSDANEIELAWDKPSSSGLDSFYVAYRSEYQTNASEVDTRDLNLKLDNGIVPGERYYVDIYSVKGGNSFSEPVYLEIATKPLPPTGLSINPNYESKSFEALATLVNSASSRQDSCILQYISDEDAERGISLDSVNNVTAVPQSDYCRWLLPLNAGKSYKFRAWTVRGTFAVSDPYTNSTIIEPAFDADLFGVTVLAEEKSLIVHWNIDAISEYWPSLIGKDGNLSASLMNLYHTTRMINPLTTTAGIAFDGLASGTCYTIQVYAVSYGMVSRNRTRYTLRLDPSDASISLANSTSTTAVLTLKTESPPWILHASCRIVINVKDDGSHTVLNKTMLTGQPTTTNPTTVLNDWTLYIFVTNLKAFSKYDVLGEHICGDESDDCELKRRTLAAMKFETSQGAPGPVKNIRVDVQTPSIAVIHWDPPDQVNGMLSGYLITIYPDAFNGEDAWNVSWPVNERSFTIQNLTGGFKYSFDVRAQTVAGLGVSASADAQSKQLPTIQMLIWAPPKPFGRPEILYATVRETDFTVRFNLSMFSTRNGMLEGYTVIVVEGDGNGKEDVNSNGNASVGTWFDVQSLSVWPAYAALSKPLSRVKNLDSRSITEVIGVDMDCPKIAAKKLEEAKRSDAISSTTTTQFCNGPLRPGKKYRIKLRIYTSNQLYSDSDYSDVVITSSETVTTAGTVVAIILGLLVIVALAVGILIFLRGRGTVAWRTCVRAKARILSIRDTLDSSSTSRTVSVNDVAIRQRSLRERTGIDGRLDKLSSQNPHQHHQFAQLPTVLASANTDISRPVLKTQFSEHVRLMSADSDFRFSEEYEQLKQVGRNEPCTAADIPCNRNKNRFTNILPYDHSRVKLVPVDDEEGSDYINASYIPGYTSPREYIAAQGPLPSTRDDFWRMIWEQNCPAIVNLTRCIEKGREKCDQYWPGDTDPVYYGDVEVLLMNETRFPDWTVREFRVSNAGQARTVRHFHFTAWPDFGVPEKPQTLVKFVRAMRARIPQPDISGPLVVHCSAGVGRSGTLIAIDRLLQHVDTHDYMDIYGIVYEMRKERAWMVQTEQQYICIHQCILCVLEGRENEDNVTLYAPRPIAPDVEVHQNPAFEDDEGIAESGV